jgi:fatty acid desaturase
VIRINPWLDQKFVPLWFLEYILLAVVGSWVYPLLTVHLPHRNYGDTPLTQTKTLRGRLIPALFLELTYHLEHHLFPQICHIHYAALARLVEKTCAKFNVKYSAHDTFLAGIASHYRWLRRIPFRLC